MAAEALAELRAFLIKADVTYGARQGAEDHYSGGIAKLGETGVTQVFDLIDGKP